jgi:hypothetical protein
MVKKSSTSFRTGQGQPKPVKAPPRSRRIKRRGRTTDTRQGQQKVVKVIVEKQGTPKVVKPPKSGGGGRKA